MLTRGTVRAAIRDTLMERDDSGAAIDVRSMDVTYGSAAAVRRLTLRVEPGTVGGIVGVRGSGKTSILRALATLVPYRNGAVRVLGIDPKHEPAQVRRLVGYLPEAFGHREPLPVSEWLSVYAAMQGVPATQRPALVEELLELVDLDADRATPVSHLPTPSRRWLGLACSLINDPEVLLLDEPFRELDLAARGELAVMLGEIAQLGKTVLLTSESEAEIHGVCSRLVFIRAGRLVETIRSGLAPTPPPVSAGQSP
jgi:ABC-2 type transport system ATP-binding protein